MTPRTTTTRAPGRRSASAGLDRMQSHREGARLLAKRESAIPTLAEAEAKPGPIRQRDKLFFFAQLAVMVQAGVPIAVALDGIARQCEREKLREILLDVLERVEAGQSFSNGLMQHPKVFPSAACHLVRAGETSGDLGGMLGRINGLLERDYEMKKKLKSALTYPAVMIFMAIGTVVALFTFILPRFRGLYAGKEDALPAPTKFLLATGDFLSVQWMWIVGGVAVVAAALIAWLRTEHGKSARDSALLALPVIGTVVRKFSLARSVRTMGALLASGVPVLQAIELARDLSANRRLGEAWEYVRTRVADGGRLQDGMVGQPWFPGTLVQMTAVGESGGILDSVLVKVGEFYDQEAEISVGEATSLIEPLMVAVVGGIVGFIAMSIMLPIFNMGKLTH